MIRSTIALAAAAFFAAGAGFAQSTDEAQNDDTLNEAVTQNEAIANNSAFGNWLLNCEAITTADVRCRLVQLLSRAEDNALIVQFIVLAAGDGTHLLLAQTPIGVYLPGGAVYRFADNEDVEQREMIWQRCIGDICEAAIRIDEAERALFAEHDTLLFGFRVDVETDPIIVGVDISEFENALKALDTSGS